MKVIINSDDLGHNTQVNERAFDLIERQKITSATLIANAPALEEAVRQARKYPACSFGIHLNLTEFSPLTPPSKQEELKSYLNEKGEFAGEATLRAVPIKARAKTAFFKEWCLQVKRVLALGLPVTHFDSHNHVHTMPALFSVLKQVQREYGIRKIRTTWNVYPSSSQSTSILLLKKRFWSLALRHYYRTLTTKAFTSFGVFHSLANGPGRTKLMTYDSIELMVHPGNQDFSEETRLVEGEWQRDLGWHGKLISYHDL